MVILYTQACKFKIMEEDEFTNYCTIERVHDKINFPMVTFEPFRIGGGLNNIQHKIINHDYSSEEIDGDVHKSDEYINLTNAFDEISCRMVKEGFIMPSIYAVPDFKTNKIYFYSRPTKLYSGKNYRYIDTDRHKVFSCNFNMYDLIGHFQKLAPNSPLPIKKIKATKLAKKMYPNKKEYDGWFYFI